MGIFLISSPWSKYCVFWGENVLEWLSRWFKCKKMMICSITLQIWGNFQILAEKSIFRQNRIFSPKFVSQNWNLHNFFSIRSFSWILVLQTAKMLDFVPPMSKTLKQALQALAALKRLKVQKIAFLGFFGKCVTDFSKVVIFRVWGLKTASDTL